MDFYAIPPLNNVDLHHNGDRYFCLAQHYLANEEYRNFFNNLPDDAWVTLDNGAGDFDTVTPKVLLGIVQELNPNEVIPLDILFNKQDTMVNATRFRTMLAGIDYQGEVMFVPQGATQEDWIDCYVWALQQSWIDTIGMSKIGIPFAFNNATQDNLIMESRHKAFDVLRINGLMTKPMHFLGLGDPNEFAYYMCFPEGKFVRSNDSCNSVWSAMNKQSWAQGHFNRIATPSDYFERTVTDEQAQVADENMEWIQTITHI
tara:strand:+ start:1141 stop:1917 length:777 start_codon:yes stop_codon:yes gene_type:complete